MKGTGSKTDYILSRFSPVRFCAVMELETAVQASSPCWHCHALFDNIPIARTVVTAALRHMKTLFRHGGNSTKHTYKIKRIEHKTQHKYTTKTVKIVK